MYGYNTEQAKSKTEVKLTKALNNSICAMLGFSIREVWGGDVCTTYDIDISGSPMENYKLEYGRRKGDRGSLLGQKI